MNIPAGYYQGRVVAGEGAFGIYMTVARVAGGPNPAAAAGARAAHVHIVAATANGSGISGCSSFAASAVCTKLEVLNDYFRSILLGISSFIIPASGLDTSFDIDRRAFA